MANKNTRRARAMGLTNQEEITIGTGASRTFGKRTAEPVFNGRECNTSRPAGKKKWVGAKVAEKFLGQGSREAA